jgi:hypothetical protein
VEPALLLLESLDRNSAVPLNRSLHKGVDAFSDSR